jgi:hypothetical protein
MRQIFPLDSVQICVKRPRPGNLTPRVVLEIVVSPTASDPTDKPDRQFIKDFFDS